MKNWRRLDNSAKIFPLSTGKKYSTVFRLSVVLKEDIQPEILQKAVISTLEKYKSFKVKIKKGFFWHYLENNAKIPFVEEETYYPCKYINPALNRGYLFKVTYFKNKINIDIFHSLTDGNGGTVFFRELVYIYLEMCHTQELKNNNRTIRRIEDYKMVANITMLVLAIVSYKNYTKYALYKLIIVLVSIIQIVPALMNIIEYGVLNQISIGISLLNLVISSILSYKDFGKMLECKFHI